MSNDLIDRQVIIDLIDAELAGVHSEAFIAGLNHARDLVSVEPAVRPIVVINVTGGVADCVAATHPLEVEVLDYDINDNEQDNYIVDEDGDQAWLYGECPQVDPAEVERILNYPTVADQTKECGQCEGTGRTQSMSNLEDEVCPVCDGEGTL